MKKTLLFIFAANLFFAQNAGLLNTNWQVTKVVGETFNDQVPPPMPYQQLTQFNSNSSQVNLSFFNTVSANLTYSGENMFKVNDKACTLADYWGDNGEVNQFFGLLCSFFIKDTNYFYTIVNNGNEKTLTISNAIFQEIHFKSINLGTKENELFKVVLAPNPVKNILTVTYSTDITSAKIFDSSGKLVYDKKDENVKTLNIDMRNFKTGTYFIQLNNKETQKIIKQ
ncbi:T9SS type A sorting domain-containing protein [Epilithonimonas sp. UC225_85]|uniref:T9SS type A sorting domain-containing protein n=1 Tax=Epilithonimonas sp. UC225_85 TaxID=3350167 RepID=UPI0036D2D978